MHNTVQIGKKELASFFTSPAGYIFLGVFLGANLFIFFWVEKFFARNIADVRPLFEWMPVLLIFLVAALTMRAWSEERRSGTLEFILASPVPPINFVFGKFIASLGLVLIALGLTLPLPITVAILGPIDWGPVLGAYIATAFLAAAYISIGLFVSARTDNQIVSLIISSLICGVFYLLGAGVFTGLFGNVVAEFLQLIGSGSRFESITRGVLDVRDLYYYLSILGVFLTLNLFSLERLRWAERPKVVHRRWQLISVLVVANLLFGNLWIQQVNWARLDMTQGRIFSISDATRGYLSQLREPLLIRGYFSAQTHPLLAPLVPKLRDLIKEYGVAGDGSVRVEFIDPLQNPELEEEANRRFGIKPVPFQTSSKYQASVTNSYFDVVVSYGDQFEALGFRDFIDIKAQSESDLNVALRNPEYDITRAIKKVIYGYQAGGDLFQNIDKPVVFKGYVSGDAKLPKELKPIREVLDSILKDMEKDSNGKFTVEFVDPDADGGAVANKLTQDYGFRPLAVGLLDSRRFWLHMTLESAKKVVQVPLPETFEKGDFKRTIEAGLKRFSKGFLKTIAVYAPSEPPMMRRFNPMAGGKTFDLLMEKLRENTTVRNVDLQNGIVPDEADILMILAPKELDEKQLFAIDQFVMKGGTTVMVTSPFKVSMQQSLSATKLESGLTDWLKHHGIEIEKSMVLDTQNSAFPVPVSRNIGGLSIQEIRMLEYPYFADVRTDGLNPDVEMTSSLGQVTMNWASPVRIDHDKNKNRTVTSLVESSDGSWASEDVDIQPDFNKHGRLGFPVPEERGPNLLAVSVEGRFDSYFKDKPLPLLNQDTEEKEEQEANKEEDKEETKPAISGIIEKSPESGRLILFASNMFATDSVIDLAASVNRSEVLNSVQLLENAIDWSLEDRGLLSIRSRGHFARTLLPMSSDMQAVMEYGNYVLAILGLFAVYGGYRGTRRRAMRYYMQILNEGRV